MTSSLNQGQKDAAEGFFQFLFSPEREFGISGGGGVGKTHLMGQLIDTIMPRYHDTCKLMGIKPEFDDVQMTATTNKAAEVLAQNTQRPTSTIHSFLRLKVRDNYKTGQSEITRREDWTVHERKVVFIDECSMIDTPLDIATSEGLHGCKIVYVGDHCQLSPVMEKISPIYKRGYPFYELTEPMRTTIPALQDTNAQLRETVETGEFKPIRLVPGIIDWLDDTAMQQELVRHFQTQTQNARVLAYTNNRVIQFNDYIRSIRNLPDAYTTGEFLVNNTAIQLSKNMLPVEAEITILNQAPNPETVSIGSVDMLVRKTKLSDNYGRIFDKVKVPEDRAHFKALLNYFRTQKNWNVYFTLIRQFPDLRPRDAATIHKAQGSTYDTVFIDLGDVSTCHNPDQVARMLYVAFSRARSRIFLFGELASKYGGLFRP